MTKKQSVKKDILAICSTVLSVAFCTVLVSGCSFSTTQAPIPSVESVEKPVAKTEGTSQSAISEAGASKEEAKKPEWDGDLYYFYGKTIDDIKVFFPNLKDEEIGDGSEYYIDEEEIVDGAYSGPSFSLSDDGIVNNVSYSGNRYSMNGIVVGMDYQEAVKTIKSQGWSNQSFGFVHGLGTAYLVYQKGDQQLYLESNEGSSKHSLEEYEVTGKVSRITIMDIPEEVQPEVIDVYEYTTRFDELQKLLDMITIPSWQFGGEAYSSWEFDIEYGGGMWSMRNTNSPYVSFCGVMLSDSFDSVPQKLEDRGWTLKYDDAEFLGFYRKVNDGFAGVNIVEFYRASDGTIDYWYANNWPQGEDYADI